MSNRAPPAIALLLLGSILGWVASRVFGADTSWLSYGVVALVALSAGVLGTLAIMHIRVREKRTARKASTGQQSVSTHGAPQAPAPQKGAPLTSLAAISEETSTAALAPVAVAPSVRSARVFWLSPHFALTRLDNRFSVRFNHLNRYEFIKLSVSISRAWIGNSPELENGKIHARETTVSQLGVLARPGVLPWLLFGLSLLVFVVTRLVALEQFPIYFFSDEAVNPVLASDLLQRGMRDAQGRLFPAYFQNGSIWSLSLSVYIHAVTVWLFGISIWVTRVTSAAIALSSAAAVGLTCKYIFNIRWWWLGTLVLAIIPAWFLHSRTGFETVLMVSFYGWLLFTYLLYRYRDPRFLYAALAFAAATFYSYANGQAVMVLTGLLLLLTDLPYHWQQRRVLLRGVVLLGVLAIPYIRFRWEHPDVIAFQLQVVDSYWLKEDPLQAKIVQFVRNYAYGLSPAYWFVPNGQDLIRHRMKDYGHIVWWLLPFFFIGLGVCVARIKSSAHRAVLVALLAAPFGSALATIFVTRALLFVIPAAMLSVIGFDFLISNLRGLRWQWATATAATVALVIFSLGMLNDAVVNGPLWYRDYTLGGMQWGAKQLFEVLREVRHTSPTMPVVVTSSWANGANQFLKFFMPGDANVTMRTIDTWIENQVPLSNNTLFVVTPRELERARASGKFQAPTVERTLTYPDDTPGFYLVRFAYIENIDRIFEQERIERAKPVTSEVEIRGEKVRLVHSRMDAGQLKDMFDGNMFTLSRGLEANPLQIELRYPTPRPIEELYAAFGKMRFTITVELWAPNAPQPKTYSQTVKSDAEIPEVTMGFDNPPPLVDRVRVQIQNLNVPGMSKIHVRELQLR